MATLVQCLRGSIATMVEDDDNKYAERLRDAMGGTSMQALADALGLSYNAVKKVLNGGTGYFKLPNHYAAADFLKVDPRWLATGEGDRAPKPQAPIEADWRTIAITLARSHPYEEKRKELTDFIRRVDEEFAEIKKEAAAA